MIRAFVGAALLIAGAAQAQRPAVEDVLKKVRGIEGARLKGQIDAQRMELEAEARQKPADAMLRVYIAWCGIPSDDAWNALRGVSSVNPDNPWPHLGMGKIYFRWKMKDQAEGSFRAALKADPRFHPALTALGDLARAAGNLPQAEKQYRDALVISDDAEAHAGLGLTLLAAGRPEEARKELARAMALWPEQPEVLAALAKLARDAKDLPTATETLQHLVALAPKDKDGYRALGELYAEQGKPKEAVEAYERALHLGAPDADVLKRLAALDKELADAAGEERSLRALAVLDKADPEFPSRLAELAEAKGALDEAELQAAEAKRRSPAQAGRAINLARIQVKRGELREARESYLAALGGEGDKPAELQKELDELTARFRLPKKPARGSVDQIYGIVSGTLNALYLERLKERPDLGGALRIRVKVDEAGKTTAVEWVEDSVGDPVLAGHLYFALQDAQFPKHKREPLFEFELKPAKTQ